MKLQAAKRENGEYRRMMSYSISSRRKRTHRHIERTGHYTRMVVGIVTTVLLLLVGGCGSASSPASNTADEPAASAASPMPATPATTDDGGASAEQPDQTASTEPPQLADTTTDTAAMLGQVTEGEEAGMQTYTNQAYGFTFHFPNTWTLEERANLIKLNHDSTNLVIWYKRTNEQVHIQGTGQAIGKLQTIGIVSFMGQELNRDALIIDNQTKAVFYNNPEAAEITVGDLVFAIRMDESIPDYAAIDVPEAMQLEADDIVASFEYTS